MAKKSSAELKAEGAELSALVATARRRPMNFALLIGKEGIFLEAHPTKAPDVMRRQAKANGGGPKGAQGVMAVSGKLIELTCETDDVPRNLGKLAKRHLAERGIAFKVVLILPGGERLEDEEDGEASSDGGMETESDPTEEPTAPDPRAAELAERHRKLTEELGVIEGDTQALSRKLAEADTALEAEDFDTAQSLLEEVEDGIARMKAAPPSVDTEALRATLGAEFDAQQAALAFVVANGGKGVPGKATQIAAMFEQEIAGDDLKKAGSVLALLKTFLKSEKGKIDLAVATAAADRMDPQAALEGPEPMPAAGAGPSEVPLPATEEPHHPRPEPETSPEVGAPPPEGEQGWADWARDQANTLGETLSDAASGLKTAAEERLEKIKDGAADLYDSAKDFVEDNVLRAELIAKGYPAALREFLVERVETDPAVVEEAKRKLTEFQSLKLSNSQEFMLLSLYFTEPAAFAAASAALATLDPGNSVDISVEAIARAEADMRAADALYEQHHAEWEAADQALQDARNAMASLQAERDALQGGVTAAEQAVHQFEAALGDLTSLTPEELAASKAERDRLAAELKTVTDDLAAKQAELVVATADEAAKVGAEATAQTNLDTSTAAYLAAEDIQKEQDNKRGLLDALGHGALSPGAVPPFDDAQKATLIDTYATSPALGRSAMNIAANADDPAMIVRNLPMIAAKFADGFADPSGQAVQRDGADLSEEERAQMAENALRMGARQGEDYFTGFDAYLKSGAQHQPDPSGGMDAPVSPYKKEQERLRQVATNRSVGLADSAIGPDGTVDFNSVDAKAAMERMKFHPGSLLVFTPMVTENAQAVQSLFDDPATAQRAQAAIKGTTLPPDDSDLERDRTASQTLIGRTVGKDPALVGDADARTAVLSAMISPLSQGSVGSCFTTAPTRRIRENDPLRAMESYASLASDGMFETHDKQRYPANLMAPPGDNLLMRSWEYSAADAAAEAAGGTRSAQLDKSLKGLDEIAPIVGADVWAGGGTDADGDLIPGIESKLTQAVTSELIYRYNTGPTPEGGVGGDGSSNSGFFELLHNGTVIDTEAKFYAAIKDIALRASGETATTPKGLAIIALIDTQGFKDKVADGVRYAGAETVDFKPWEIGGGGWVHEVDKVLSGGDPKPEPTPMLPSGNDPNVDPGQRTRSILDGVLGTDPVAMTLVSTNGKEADHAFNLLPSNPSLDRLRDPDSDVKIRRELLEPGAAIAKANMPVDQAQSLYQAQIRQLSSWAWKHPAEQALLTQALSRSPTSAMTPGDLAKLIDTETTAFKQAVATRRADDWKAEELAAGRTVSTADYTAKKAEFEDEKAREISHDMGNRLVNAFPLPEVVIADTNWGGAGSHTYFVIIPDPRTGDLQLWTKDAVTGELSVADEYREARWKRVQE